MIFSLWHTTYAVRGPLATSHTALLRLVVGSFQCAVAVFLAVPPFLHCLLDFSHSFLSVGFSFVYYADFIIYCISPFTWFSVSHHSLFLLLFVVCSSHLALLLQVSPSYAASACLLSLFRFPASFGDPVLFSCPLLLFFFLRFLFPEWKFAPSLAVLGLSARLPFQHFPIVSVVHLPLSIPPVRCFTFIPSALFWLRRISCSRRDRVLPLGRVSSIIGFSLFTLFSGCLSFACPSAPLLLLVLLVLFRVSLLFLGHLLLLFVVRLCGIHCLWLLFFL